MLVNNVANDDRHNFMDVTPEYYDARIAVNQRPAFFAIQAVVPGMKQLGGGSIINFGSNSYGGKARNMPVYTTAKSSVIGLTRGLAAELGEHRIRINVITPGWIMTPRQIEKWLTPEGELEIQRNQVLPDKVGRGGRGAAGAVPGVRRCARLLGAGIHRRRGLVVAPGALHSGVRQARRYADVATSCRRSRRSCR